jgi:hypothetical protein
MKPMKLEKDGLYIVNHGTITAAFVVREGKVTECAPILRKNFDFFARKATWYPTNLRLKPLEMEEEPVPA